MVCVRVLRQRINPIINYRRSFSTELPPHTHTLTYHMWWRIRASIPLPLTSQARALPFELTPPHYQSLLVLALPMYHLPNEFVKSGWVMGSFCVILLTNKQTPMKRNPVAEITRRKHLNVGLTVSQTACLPVVSEPLTLCYSAPLG